MEKKEKKKPETPDEFLAEAVKLLVLGEMDVSGAAAALRKVAGMEDEAAAAKRQLDDLYFQRHRLTRLLDERRNQKKESGPK